MQAFCNTHSNFHMEKTGEVSQNWNFFKIVSFLHHLKALNESISEWAYTLNLAKWFWRYLHFSAPKKRAFLDKTWENLHILNGTENIIFVSFAIF